MTDRVIVLDDFIPIRDLSDSLATEGISVEVVHQSEIPSGPGVVALLVGPEIAGLAPHHLSDLPDLRLLSATSAGYDHLPVSAAHERGLWVTRAVDYCTEEVADHALALTLGLLRSTHVLDRSVHAGEWDVTAAPPRRIAGTVLGLYGFGRIADAFARRARALEMTVLVSGRGLGDRAEELAAEGIEVVGFEDLLRRSDVLSLHVPLTSETRGLIDERALSAMTRGAYLVNVSRGGLVDHDALATALRTGQLAGAAVDVLPNEPPAQDDPALQIPNLVITPHAGWYSPQVAQRLARQSAHNVAAVLRGASPVGVVAAPGM
ncbi:MULTISPECIES: NAD(P)-dependent oxidoreductase [unclassified Rhodococcus (in: high G+C Gram-positive bacteria)]|uniref:NAD(P)-dependent oxidoreductase n=1 Tax=unclassified Rhodococcus (in: high G+C Gram-positive bacteria) TaxID=192944 RepID=UPI00163B1B8E|nr:MULTISPECIES: NAD(P)-dependent oxidoreductase [unclassified Rhodococcus (in: high G+C Gram-positive bacteria)]MBC2642208.1 C-terminal binding protein [Rhodococcus sp. 3A]MBC2893050.1 C-terminal binding protein [Rhodococcus sp. 4CII]